MTRTVAREIAIQLSFAAQLAGEDARETAGRIFQPGVFRDTGGGRSAVPGVSGRYAA